VTEKDQKKKPHLFAVITVSAVALLQVLLLLLWGDSAMRASNIRGNGGGDIGIRFGESIYYSPEPARSASEQAMMLVYCTYPIWFAMGVYGAWRLLGRGHSFRAVIAMFPAFLPLAAGMVSIAMYAMEVRKSGEKFFDECQIKHPGVPGQIVIRESSGKLTDGPWVGIKRQIDL